MNTTTTTTAAPAQCGEATGRVAFAALATLLLAAIAFEATEHSPGYGEVAVFALVPDLALLYGLRARDGHQRS